jgi:flagellar hook-length control protein FliK
VSTPATATPDAGVATVSAVAGHDAGTGGHGSTGGDTATGQNTSGGQAPAPAPAPAAQAPAPTPQPPAVSAPASTTAPTTAAAAVPTAYGVRLAEAAEKVSNTIAMGARDGMSVARIELSPESLGAIQIHLQHTPDGLVARVVTEHPEAAQTLSQGGDDLKRQLQQNGTALLRLDIESSGQQGAGRDGQAGSTASSNDSSSGSGGSSDEDAADAGPQSSADTPLHTLSSSALVNVLA